MPITAFQPSNANTQLIAATSSTASVATQVCAGSQQGMAVANPSTLPVYLAFGSSSVQAAVPTTAVRAPGLCLPAGNHRAFATPPAGWLSAVTSAGSANIFATPGFGG